MLPDENRFPISQPDDSLSELQTKFEKLRDTHVQTRREMMRWKMIARQHAERLTEMESSASWRYYVIARALAGLARRWKTLLLITALACLSLPLFPVLIIVMLFPAGRALARRVLWKFPPYRHLLTRYQELRTARKRFGRDETSKIEPLIYRRPSEVESNAAEPRAEAINWRLLQQLSPRRRLLLQDYALTQNSLIRDNELPDLQSLSYTEISLLKISVGGYSHTGPGEHGSQ